jgi:hypothetical protein
MKIFCAISNNHIVKDPVFLSCQHFICNSCLTSLSINNIKLECQICGNMISESLVKQKDSEILKDLINMSLNDLFNQLEENTTKELNKFKSIFKFK